jgi:ABC-type transport system involved in cytochrome c biogenesis permease subunit
MRKTESDLQRQVKSLIAKKGKNLEKYSDTEKLLALGAMQMDLLSQTGSGNILFRIIPPQWSQDGEWASPWQTLLDGGGSPATGDYLAIWKAMAKAYGNGDRAAWIAHTQAAVSFIKADADIKKSRLEVLYQSIHPLYLAEMLYGTALILLALSFWRQRDRLYKLSIGAAAIALACHGIALIVRIILLERPPVGTLYESLLFVSLALFLCAFWIECVRRDRVALAAGLGGTLALLYAAPVFSPMGDSLEVLVAVLNTSFWLSTHVICITIGYGVSLLAGMVAHFSLLRQDGKLDALLHKILVAALFFTAFGTMLGGIWADQSWGRFWGWDPKENGALLIVVWIAWILHGRYGGYLRGVTYYMAAAYLNVIVALAWFGVNLLNVGLHSYGFTNEMAFGLALFCMLETILIGLAFIRRVK